MAVLSIIQQTFQHWELLIIDDGSTDNAMQDIADIIDVRIKVFRDGNNHGLAARLNEAIDFARGTYFARMDQDDVSFPDRFARQIEALQNDPRLDLVAVRAVTVSVEDQVMGLLPYAITHEEVCARPWMGFYFPHPTWMGRIEWFRKYRYTVPGPYCSEDQELLLRSFASSRFVTIPEVLFAYRIRKKINVRKHFFTRFTVLKFQLRYLFAKLDLFQALLSILVFVGRIFSDLLKHFISVFGLSNVFRPRPVEAQLLTRWEEVRKALIRK